MFSHEAGKNFIMNFKIYMYCSFHHDGVGIFNFFFDMYFEMVNKIRQVSKTISEFTHSIKQPCGRCDIKFT